MRSEPATDRPPLRSGSRPVARDCPRAARPIITAAIPASISSRARSCEPMSPDATTGTSTSPANSAVSEWSAPPLYICLCARGCRTRARAPALASCGPSSMHVREPGSIPLRNLTVTGVETAAATSSTIRQASRGCSSSAAPAPVAITFRTGQPKLRSTRSAPAASATRAASAISAGSEPKICTASGCSSEAMRR